MVETQLPEGLETINDGRQLKVRDNYKNTVYFDDIFPGDLLEERIDQGKFYFITSRDRKGIHGYWFSGRGMQGGRWNLIGCNVPYSQVDPSLTRTILNFYDRDRLASGFLDSEQNG